MGKLIVRQRRNNAKTKSSKDPFKTFGVAFVPLHYYLNSTETKPHLATLPLALSVADVAHLKVSVNCKVCDPSVSVSKTSINNKIILYY